MTAPPRQEGPRGVEAGSDEAPVRVFPRGCLLAAGFGVVLVLAGAVAVYTFRYPLAAMVLERGNVGLWRSALELSDLWPEERAEGARLADALVQTVREGRVDASHIAFLRALDGKLQAAVRGDRFDAEALRGIFAELRALE